MLHYEVTVADPKGHYFDVQLHADFPLNKTQGDADSIWVELDLPAWIPGSYLIREFARNILYVNAAVNGAQAKCVKVRKDCWRVVIKRSILKTSNTYFRLHCDWRVYAWDLSVRGAHLDETHGFFNGSSLFLCPKGLEELPIELRMIRPSDGLADWTVACGLISREGALKNSQGCPVLKAGGAVAFLASNYDDLIDHPVEMGELQLECFDVLGVQHVFAVYGADGDLDLERICNDLKPVCEGQIALFEPERKCAPFERYVFMLHATDKGYGGLEHRNSTALLCNTSDLPQRGVEKAPQGYEGILGLCSHEYFHAWNVKRIKPQAFVPYDLTQENYTRLLWVFEGFTSYYDDLMLARAGVLDETEYLKLLSQTVAQVMKGPGRLNQSVADSSFDAWIKYYRQDENAPNSLVSYYTKGALVALCIDSSIRLGSRGEKSLDDVMRLMWQRKGLTGIGLGEHELPELIQEATGIDLAHELRQWTEEIGELPLVKALSSYGFSMTRKASEDAVSLEMSGQFNPDGLCVKQVINAGPAHLAGIAAGDVLVAIGNKRLTEKNYKRFLSGAKPGQTVTLLGFRAERLLQFAVLTAAPVSNEWFIKKQDGADNSATVTAPWLPVG